MMYEEPGPKRPVRDVALGGQAGCPGHLYAADYDVLTTAAAA
jgi:hypothetical protein